MLLFGGAAAALLVGRRLAVARHRKGADDQTPLG